MDENALAGDRGWDRDRLRSPVRAYLATASVEPGEVVGLRGHGDGAVDVEWYRLGWYGGAGARLLRVDHDVHLRKQPSATVSSQTGLVEANWTPVLGTEAPLGAPSGMLLVVLRQAGKAVASTPVVLRPSPMSARRAPVLFISAAATWQAYNKWGGFDLYSAKWTVPATQGKRAAVVSFDRPYLRDGGAGFLRRWELQFIRWMERNGRDVEYIADVDLEQHPSLVDGRRLLVMAGHPEYWSRPMRERVEAAVATGTNVAFLTANEIYWQTRLEDGPAGPGTRITCYKGSVLDPVAASQPSLATGRWRSFPVSDPEATLIGQMYGSIVNRVADWVVAEPGHWLYEGTGLAAGDHLSNLIGQEFDSYFPELAPDGTVVLARGPVDAVLRDPDDPDKYPSPPIHTATAYTAASGATVLAAGTFQWSWAIDGYGDRSYNGVATPRDVRVERMTANIFDRLGDGPLAP